MTTYADPGAIADVVGGGSPGRMEATWGNAIRSRVVNRFATTSDRDSAITSPTDGMCAYVTATHTLYVHNGTTWRAYDVEAQTYTPTWTQTATITKTVTQADYSRDGDWCSVAVALAATSGGTAATAVVVTTPVTASAAPGAVMPVGSGFIYDQSANLYYPVVVLLSSTTTFAFLSADAATSNYVGATGATFTAAIASGDLLYFAARYRIA